MTTPLEGSYRCSWTPLDCPHCLGIVLFYLRCTIQRCPFFLLTPSSVIFTYPTLNYTPHPLTHSPYLTSTHPSTHPHTPTLNPLTHLLTHPSTHPSQVISNVKSLDQIGKAGAKDIFDYFTTQFGAVESASFKKAQAAFIKSMAGYAVVCYLLRIKVLRIFSVL